MVGDTSGNIDGYTNAGNYDIFIIKYNSSGTKQWAKLRGTSSADYAQSVAIDTSGNIYVAGQTIGGMDNNTSSGEADIFVIKYDSNGNNQ